MSDAEKESTLPKIQAELAKELERLRSGAEEGSDEAIRTVAQWLSKLGTKLADVVPSAQFSAVLFDVGGVLLTNGWDHKERAAVLAQFGLDKDTFEARHPEPYDALERDTISMLDYLNATIFYEPRSFTPEEFIEAMKLVSVPIPSNGIEVLSEIAASNRWLVGVLNNESRLLHEYRMEKYKIGEHLDVQLSSCYLALRKPEPAIYKRALDILGLPGERVIFIDDRKGNADAAAAVGMHAIQFQNEAQLRFDLQQIGIL
jgi:putative hydrolase of the HAD superfamily